MSYFFHPAAEAEYLEAIAYYESKRAGLGALEGIDVLRVKLRLWQISAQRPSPGQSLAD
jgi:hypothetical protein